MFPLSLINYVIRCSRTNLFLILPLVLFVYLIPHINAETTAINLASELMKLSNEDYPEPIESTKPDNVDNEIIDKIVEHFLNKGTLDGMKTEKSNKEAQKLVNSSSYWSTENLKLENSITDAKEAVKWLQGYLAELEKILHQIAVDGWNYFTAASVITRESLEEAEEVARSFLKVSVKQARQFNIEEVFSDNPIFAQQKRQMQLIVKEGMNALDDADFKTYNQIQFNINQLYTMSALCDITASRTTPCIYKFVDVLSIFQSSNNASQSLKWWLSWRLAAGANLTSSYTELVDISNKAAKLNGYEDIGAMWRSAYDTKGFNLNDEMEIAYEQILPLYEQLHAYIRPRLASIYGGVNASANDSTRDGPIPLYLLKSLNGENWGGLYELTKPFADETVAMAMTQSSNTPQENSTLEQEEMEHEMPDLSGKDVSEEILMHFRAQNYTVKTMFTKVYRYMKYLGFEKLPTALWSKSIFSRNWSKDMICSPATAYDMIDVTSNDYRIKVCAQLSEQDFVNAHKLIAQLYYKYLSRNQTVLLRDAPNPSLASATSSAFGILGTNSDYLKSMNLLGSTTEYSDPYVINRLYREALEQFVSLPFLLIADKWRYSVFEGRLKPSNWSNEWRKLREDYQGISMPTSATIEKLFAMENDKGEISAKLNNLKSVSDFDAVASPMISQQHAPASRNFVSYILQFQILKHLCPKTNALNQGCIPDKKVVKKIIDTMSKGSSITWLNAMEQLTGTKKLDAAPLLEYYEPLFSWLKNSNKHENVIIGWKHGKGEPFTEAELPKLRYNPGDNDQKQFLPEEEQIAYPGQSCVNGQECLLDSVCNGTICVCRDGLFTLQIADTYNCVPGNPAHSGFTDEDGGLVIALNPQNNTSSTSDEEEAKEKDQHNNHAHNHSSSNSDHKHLHEPSNAACTLRMSISLTSSVISFIFIAFGSILFAQL